MRRQVHAAHGLERGAIEVKKKTKIVKGIKKRKSDVECFVMICVVRSFAHQ